MEWKFPGLRLIIIVVVMIIIIIITTIIPNYKKLSLLFILDASIMAGSYLILFADYRISIERIVLQDIY